MKKILSLLLVTVLLISTFVPMAYAEEELTYGIALRELDIISGDKDGNLNGDKAITRGELITIINSLTTSSTDTFKDPATASFSDVPKTHWAYRFIERAKANNVTQGVGNGKFGVNDKVTYKQARAFMLNMLGYTVAWNDVEAYADELGIYCKAANNAPLLTRDMMFEILWKSLVAPTIQYRNFIHAVAENDYIGIDSTDIRLLSDANIVFLEREATPLNLAVENFIFSTTNYNLHEQLPYMSDSSIEHHGRYYAKYYYNLFNNVNFTPSTMKTLYDSYIAFKDLKGNTDSEMLNYVISLRDDATDTENDYFIEFLEDGTVTMELMNPSITSIKYEKISLNIESVWISDGHPSYDNLKSFVVNLSHPNKKYEFKFVYMFDYKSPSYFSKLEILEK